MKHQLNWMANHAVCVSSVGENPGSSPESRLTKRYYVQPNNFLRLCLQREEQVFQVAALEIRSVLYE